MVRAAPPAIVVAVILTSLWPLLSIWFFAFGESITLARLFELHTALSVAGSVYMAAGFHRLGIRTGQRWLTIAWLALAAPAFVPLGAGVVFSLIRGSDIRQFYAIVGYIDQGLVVLGMVSVAIATRARIGIALAAFAVIDAIVLSFARTIDEMLPPILGVALIAACQLGLGALAVVAAARIDHRAGARRFDQTRTERRLARLPWCFLAMAILMAVSLIGGPVLMVMALRVIGLLAVIVTLWPIAHAQWPGLPRYALHVMLVLACAGLYRELSITSLETNDFAIGPFRYAVSWWAMLPFVLGLVAFSLRDPLALALIVALAVAAFVEREHVVVVRSAYAAIAIVAMVAAFGMRRRFAHELVKTTADVFT